MSRIRNVYNNFFTACLNDIVAQILKFIVRTIFIKELGTAYLGINGLFSNILSMLSLAELGLGSAINYQLYKSLHDNDQYRTCQLMKFYKMMYFFIGLIIGVLGCILIPFLPIIISDYEIFNELNISAVLIYLLYICQTVSSYWFFAYKSAIIVADQKESRNNLVYAVGTVCICLMQIFVLVYFQNFIWYTVVLLGGTIFENIAIAFIANKLYPYIRKENILSLSKSETRSMFKDCGAVFCYKINSVISEAMGNILLSFYLGLSSVGIYSNYMMAVYLIRSVTGKFYNAITASFGHLHADNNKEHEYEVFKVINFCTFFIYAICSVWLCCNVNMFIEVWVGKDYVINSFQTTDRIINTPINIMLGVNIYLFGMYSFLSRIRNATGLFRQVMVSPIISLVLNVVISFILVPRIGIAGILIGSILAGLCSYMWLDPLIIVKQIYGKNVWHYYLINGCYIGVTVLAFKVCDCSIKYVSVVGWIGLILKSILTVVLTIVICVLFFWKTREMKYLKKLAIDTITMWKRCRNI